MNCFVLRPGVSASTGLQKIKEGRSFTGCGELCQITYHEALKLVLGEPKFNEVFGPTTWENFAAGKGVNHFLIGMSHPFNPLSGLQRSIDDFSQALVKGQMVYFKNVPGYVLKNHNGDAQGFWTICCDATPGQERFTTLGLSARG